MREVPRPPPPRGAHVSFYLFTSKTRSYETLFYPPHSRLTLFIAACSYALGLSAQAVHSVEPDTEIRRYIDTRSGALLSPDVRPDGVGKACFTEPTNLPLQPPAALSRPTPPALSVPAVRKAATPAATNASVTIDGITYTVRDSGTEAAVFASDSTLTEAIIPEKVTIGGASYPVTAIDSTAFMNCSQLTSVQLPSTLRVIGKYAFSGCSSLAALDLPASLEEIGVQAFSFSGLESVVIPENVRVLGVAAFGVCESLTSVDIRCPIEELPIQVFYYCPSLSSVTLPGTLRVIEEQAFGECKR